MKGKTLVDVQINETGHIEKIEIIKSLNKTLDKAIISALEKIETVKLVTVNGIAHKTRLNISEFLEGVYFIKVGAEVERLIIRK
ncbi:MAG: TonB C-terminal domain-containing protein [Bacteroidetes bacterium]|nr:TonB C-terminal domain-containing protein [Bacteroidota bacterium]MDF1867380.1 energy transducer TonB [Saprospiraceae bacterium]